MVYDGRVAPLTYIQKRKRIEDKKLLETYRHMSCTICHASGYGQVVAHHIKTKGAGGHDHYKNLVPLCQEHHVEIHAKGLRYMTDKYVSLKQFLEFIHFKFIGGEIIFPDIK